MTFFKDKITVVTGAGSGIGRALAIQLSQSGAILGLNDINSEYLSETTNLLEGKNHFIQQVDVSDRKAVLDFTEQIISKFSGIDILINNAGVGIGKISTEQMSFEEFEWMMNVNFWGTVNHSKSFLPHLAAKPSAHLVNISSILGIIGIPYQSAYCSSKFAIRGFTESLRTELMIEHPGICVSVVHPGAVLTNIINDAKVPDNVDYEAYAKEEVHFKKFFKTSAEDAARIILKGIQKKKSRIMVGSDTRLPDVLVRFLPGKYSILVAKRFRSLMRKYAHKK